MKMHLGVCVPFFVLSTLANEDISSTAHRPYPPRPSRRRPLLHPPVVEVIGLTQGLIVMLSIQLYQDRHYRCLAVKTATACGHIDGVLSLPPLLSIPKNPDKTLVLAVLKFIYSEKATQFCEISTLLLSYVVPVKSKVEISLNFVTFSEYTNFMNYI